MRATFLSLLGSIPPFAPVLLLATCNLQYDQLSTEVRGEGVASSRSVDTVRPLRHETSPSLLSLSSDQVQELFRVEYGEVFHIQTPTRRERRNFFEDLLLNQAAKAPASKKKAGKKYALVIEKRS